MALKVLVWKSFISLNVKDMDEGAKVVSAERKEGKFDHTVNPRLRPQSCNSSKRHSCRFIKQLSRGQ